MQPRDTAADSLALLSVAEMYSADKAAMEADVSGVTLMSNAGIGIAESMRARWTPRDVTVLCDWIVTLTLDCSSTHAILC